MNANDRIKNHVKSLEQRISELEDRLKRVSRGRTIALDSANLLECEKEKLSDMLIARDKRISELEYQLEAKQNLISELIDASKQDCACGYDDHEDICLVHGKLLKAKDEQIEALQASKASVDEIKHIQERVCNVISSVRWGWDGDCGCEREVDNWFDRYLSEQKES